MKRTHIIKIRYNDFLHALTFLRFPLFQASAAPPILCTIRRPLPIYYVRGRSADPCLVLCMIRHPLPHTMHDPPPVLCAKETGVQSVNPHSTIKRLRTGKVFGRVAPTGCTGNPCAPRVRQRDDQQDHKSPPTTSAPAECARNKQ